MLTQNQALTVESTAAERQIVRDRQQAIKDAQLRIRMGMSVSQQDTMPNGFGRFSRDEWLEVQTAERI